MGSWREMTLGDVAAGLRRYQPFLATIVAIVLVVGFLPGEPADTGTTTTEFSSDTGALPPGVTDATTGTSIVDPTTGAVTLADGTVVPSSGGRTGTTAGGSVGAGSGPVGTGSAASGPLVANCDTSLGRIKVPSRFAPPCVPAHSGDNGGSTWGGVTKDSITVVYYRAQENPATRAILERAGAADSPENAIQTMRDYVTYFQSHFNLYGRKINFIVMEGTGETDDDATSRADAIKIATEHKAFAVLGAPTSNAFVDELVARKIMCICTVSQPVDFYLQRAPYVWPTTLMSSHQGYVHRAEYIGKRLGGKPAKWAGNAAYQQQERVFGLLYYELADGSYKNGVDFFEQELAKYGIKLKVRLAFTGANIDPTATQNQARTMMAKMRDEGVTSVIFSGDPLSPIFFTQEATRAAYFPEWILTGSALTDTAIFGRTYDQSQWEHAFGVSFLAARIVPEQAEVYRLHQWHFGRGPAAENTYAVLYANPFIFFTGVHMAGPKLTPETFRNGLFKLPPMGRGMTTSPTTSWGRHGIWQWDDYTQWDDVTEIWWDRQAAGPDEPGNQGVGLYRFVEAGKRYLPGEHPRTEPKAFDPAGTVTILNEIPPNERPPDYPPPKR